MNCGKSVNGVFGCGELSMVEPLELFWPVVDAAEPVFTADGAETWPAEAIEQLVAAGLARPTAQATLITCPECQDGHMEEVLVRDGPHGLGRLFIPCPDHLRIEITARHLLRWEVDFKEVTEALAVGLSLGGRCMELMPGRLWRLGRTNWQGTSRDVLFARGLHWEDSRKVIVRAEQNTRPIVLVAAQSPAPRVRTRRKPPVVALSPVSQLRNGQLVLDISDILAAVQEADTAQDEAAQGELDAKQLKRMIRQQVKAENETALTDDLLVAAYQQHGSMRKAAAFLTQQTSQKITKDKVQRAVERSGGIAAVVSGHNSSSVHRHVTSQRRDGKKLILNHPEAMEFQ